MKPVPAEIHDVLEASIYSVITTGHTRVFTQFLPGQGGGKPPINFSKRGGLAGSQFLEWACWKRQGDFFQSGAAVIT